MLTVAAFFCYLLLLLYLSHVFIFMFFLFTARLNGAQHLVVSMLFSLMLVMEIMMYLASAHMAFAGMLVSPIFTEILVLAFIVTLHVYLAFLLNLQCTEEAHRPVDCATVEKWILKNSAESENMNWYFFGIHSLP